MNEPVQKLPLRPPRKATAKVTSQTVRTKIIKSPSRTNDPVRTMAGILEVARQEFGEKGLAGARVDAIAAATQTSKRMIYYYFSSKEGLYLATLEEYYRRIRSIEADLHLEDLEPVQALRTLVAFTYDHHYGNEQFVRIVMSENMNRGQYMLQSKHIQALNETAISGLAKLYERGVIAGVFRKNLDPIDIHASISALTFFNVSNQHTFGLIFKQDIRSAAYQAKRRSNVVELIVRFVCAP